MTSFNDKVKALLANHEALITKKTVHVKMAMAFMTATKTLF